MKKYNHFKSGVQYSHYTGTCRSQIICSADLLQYENFDFWFKTLIDSIEELETIIKYLDKLNNLSVFNEISSLVEKLMINTVNIDKEKIKLIKDIVTEITIILQTSDLKNNFN